MPTSFPDTEATSSAHRKAWLLLIGVAFLSLLLLTVGGIAVAWPLIEDAQLRAHLRELRAEADFNEVEEPTAFGGMRNRQVVRWIQLSHDAIRKADFTKLEKLNHLESLDIYESHLDGELSQQIARLKALEGLHIGQSYLASDAIAPLAALPRLRILSIGAPSFEDEKSLAALANAPRLLNLHIAGSGLTDAGGQVLSRLSMLEEVWLDNTRVGDATLLVLKQLPKLKSLYVGDTTVTDEGIAHLASCTSLERLYAPDTAITGRTLGELRSLKNLVFLDLSKTRVTDEHVAHLRELTSVTALKLSETPLTDAAVAHLVGMPQLEVLDLEGTALTDAGLARLAQIPQLRHLRVNGTQVTAATANQVREQYPHLRLSAASITGYPPGASPLPAQP